MGIHLVLYIPGSQKDVDDDTGIAILECPISRIDVPAYAFPDGYEPVGESARGVIRFESTGPFDSEHIDGVRFDRDKLKMIRGHWPSVRFDVRKYGKLSELGSGAAIGVVDGWVVAMLAGCRP